MKISKHFEQGIYVLLILATQEGQGAVKSQTLSEKLEVSDSSLKKILRKLVV
ncbi:Rrf2 family transcriptional regulator, partial [Staphylococcus aureus]